MDVRTQRLVERIRGGIIGDDRAIDGPFGVRRVTYADYTASGRSVDFIEDFIRDEVMPLYANTHTETSTTGLQTTRFREDARRTILEALHGTDEDVVIFCGSGATGAVNKLIDILNLRLPADLDDRYGLSSQIPKHERPVVFIGPYEHHSNELPWRETIADVVVIDEDPDGRIDEAHLERELTAFADRPLKIGSFSAASNVTGHRLQHRGADGPPAPARRPRILGLRGGRALREDRDEPAGRAGDPLAAKDAIFISPHKFVGGPGTPGVLMVKRRLVTNRVPTVPGGGTVSYVSADDHSYISDPAIREEGGTPAIIESIRAGLVFKLKTAVGEDTIEELEHSFVTRAIESWSANPRIRILGNKKAKRLSIVSFLIEGDGRFLHHNYVVALLNDLFGIQARGGCSCAGPYGHRLLGIDMDHSTRFREAINSGCEGIKPGWVQGQFQLLHLRSGLQLHPRCRAPGGGVRLDASAVLQVLGRFRPLEAPRPPARPRIRTRRPELRIRSPRVPQPAADRTGERACPVSRGCPTNHRRSGHGVRRAEGIRGAAGRHWSGLRWFPLPNAPFIEGLPTTDSGDDTDT